MIEGDFDFLVLAAALIDVVDALLEIHAAFNRPQHFVARAEYALEQLEFLGQQLIHALVGGVFAVEEVYHHYVMFLSVPVTAADALLDALWIPRQIVVNNERAELKVDAFRTSFGGDH